MQSIGSIETYAYRTSENLVYKTGKNKGHNIRK